MAEWSGGARTQRRSQMAEVEIEEIRQLIPDHPDAPGAIGSPQIPGMTPDKCTVPGHAVKVVPKPTLGKRRPMSQAGTAQELIAVYTPSGPNGAWVENDFNGAHTSFEELSKVNPALTQPHRPAPGYETSRALAWLEQRSAALEAGMEELSLAAGLPMNAAGITAAEIADIPTEATLLGMAGAAAGSVTLGDYASGTWEGGRPVVPASERAGSLTGLGAPEGAVSMAAEALGHSPAADAAAHIAASARAPFADAAPPISEFSGVAGEIAAAGDGHGIRAGSGMPLSGEAAAMPLAPEGAVGFEIPAAERGGVVNAAPMPRDVMPGGVRDGGPVDAADMGGDLQPGFTTGGAAREGGDGGWLAQEETIEGVLPGHAARHAAKGAPVDAADMGGDLQPGFTTGGAAREGGDGGWLVQEEAIGGIVAGSGMGVAAIEGWDGPVPDGAIAHAGGAECPEAYPIKGNLPSRFYHLPGDFAYKVTVPEFCFNHEHAAFAAGFTRAPQRGEGGSESGGGAGGSQARSEAKAEARAETRAGNKAQRAEARGRTDVKAGTAPAAEKPAPKGAVHARGKGCPKSHPIKGNEQSGYFHRPQDPSYNFTIPEFCFATEDEAREAGFTLAGNAKRD